MKKFDRVFKQYDRFIELFNFDKMDEIKEALDLNNNEVVLDIGGGTGKLAEYLSEACQKVYVLDESQGMLSQVKANERIVPILGDGLKTGFDNDSIDIVILSDVLHHIKDQDGLIDEIYRILKRGGKVLILDLEKNHLRIRILRIFEYLLFGRLYFRSSQEAINLLQGRFTIAKSIHKGYYYIIRGEKNA